MVPITHPFGAGLFPYPHKSRWGNEMVEDDSGQVPNCCAARGPLNIQESLSYLAMGADIQQCAFWPQAKEGWASLPVRSTPRHYWIPWGAEVQECCVVRKSRVLSILQKASAANGKDSDIAWRRLGGGHGHILYQWLMAHMGHENKVLWKSGLHMCLP